MRSRVIDCEEALRRLFEYLDAELHGDPHREMEQHLERCRSCFSRAEFEKRLKALQPTFASLAVEAAYLPETFNADAVRERPSRRLQMDAMVHITSAKKDVIFEAVRAMYTDIARAPGRGYHFPTGDAACTFVGYPSEQLARLPAFAVESFAGVGYPFAANVIRAGDTVLDIGSGSGTDVLLAAQAVVPLDM